jgi:DNA-binding NarL/FixJ family response regulator/signal transduction histidine kinase
LIPPGGIVKPVMDFTYTPLVWPSAVAAAIALGLVVLSFLKGDSPISRLFSVCLFTIFAWIVTDLLEKTGVSLDTKFFWRKLSYLPIGLLPVLWFLLVVRLTRTESLGPWVTGILFLIPFLFNLGAWTNDWHHLHWSSPRLLNGPWGSYIQVERGPLFILDYAYAIALEVLSLVLLAVACRNREPLFVQQFVGFLIGELIVFLPNALYVLGVPPFNTVDVTPLALGLASLAMAWGILWFRGLEVAPLARTVMLESWRTPWFLLDDQDRLLDRNAQARVLLGLEASDLSGNFLKLPQVPEGLKAFLRDRSAASGEFVAWGSSWEVHGGWIEVRGLPFRAYGAFLIDVTDIRTAQNRLHQQEKSLVVLQERERLSRELHDSLGQQLGFLNLSAQTLYKTISEGQRENTLAGLLKLADVAQKAYQEVRYFIQVSSGAPVLPGGFLSALQVLVDRFTETYGTVVNLDLDPRIGDELLASAHQREVFLIVQEALTNARKHSGAPSVTIRLLLLDDQVRIAVIDTGIGFSPEGKAKDSGFGLRIMEDRARLAGIDLRMESSPGAGTRVILDVPRVPVDVSAPEVPRGRDGRRILVADDNALFVQGLTDSLEAGGYAVVGTARSGLEALALARALRPDAILMDIQMPDLTGLEATKLIHRELPEIRIVMLTVSASDDDLFESLRVGASAYFLKNLQSEDLFQLLDGLLRGEVTFTPAMAAKILEEGALRVPSVEKVPSLPDLSDRQKQILSLVAEGLTYKEVGVRVNLAERTIKYHVGEILGRLHLKSRAEATRLFRENR